MTWRQRAGAILGILLALGLIAWAVLSMYGRVSTQSQWTDFVRESSTEVLETRALVEEAEYTLTSALSVAVSTELTDALQEEIEITTLAVEKAEALARFVIPEDMESGGVGQLDDSQSDNPWADLDPLSALGQAPQEPVAYPDDGQKTVDYFHDVVHAMNTRADLLRVANQDVIDAMQTSLSQAVTEWQAAGAALAEMNDEALAVLQGVSTTWIPEEDEAAMWSVFHSSREVLAAAREVDETDVLALKEATQTLQDQVVRIQEVFAPYVGGDEDPPEEGVEGDLGTDGLAPDAESSEGDA